MKPQICYPVFPYRVNQDFGVVAPLYTSLGLLGHDGIDLLAGEQICYAALPGVVTEISLDYHRGLGVYVTTDDFYDVGLDKPYRLAHVYWHFKEDDVKVGDRIRVGDRLGITDNTGASSGNHLHFAIQPRVESSTGALVIAFPDNGYRGFIDPAPFWSGRYASGQVDPPKPHLYFSRNLKIGNFGLDVIKMQKMLKYAGWFNYNITGFYGDKTKESVFNWQVNNKIAPILELINLKGEYFGPASRDFANKDYQ